MSGTQQQPPANRSTWTGGPRRRWLSRRQMAMFGVGGVAIVLGIYYLQPRSQKTKEELSTPPIKTASLSAIDDWKPPPAEPPPQAKPPALPVFAQAAPPALPPVAMPELPKTQLQSGGSRSGGFQVSPLPQSLMPVSKEAADEKKKAETTHVAYKAAVIPGIKAGLMGDTTYTLQPGLIPCTLYSAVESERAGPFQCLLPGDVFNEYGNNLLPRNTWIMGNYDSQIHNGQRRLPMLAVTATTPTNPHCIVSLGGTPMADDLGRTGLDGEVNNHYLERFGAAFLLQAIDSALQIVQAEVSKGGNTYLNLNGGGGIGSLAQTILQSQINIPPTISLNQGTTAMIWITQPIDFSACYKDVMANGR